MGMPPGIFSRFSGNEAAPRSPRNQHPAPRIRYSAAWSPYSSAGPIIARRENEVSAVGAAALSRVQHVPNEAGEEDDDNADGQEKSESCVVDHALPPKLVSTLSRSPLGAAEVYRLRTCTARSPASSHGRRRRARVLGRFRLPCPAGTAPAIADSRWRSGYSAPLCARSGNRPRGSPTDRAAPEPLIA